MEIAKIEIGKTTGICTSRRRIPAGIVGATVSVVFKDYVWNDLTKTVVFRGNGSRIAEFDGTVAVIPGDVVAEPGVRLHFGIWGHNPKTGLQLPLIEIPIGITEKATYPEAAPGVNPALPIWAQLQQDIEDLKSTGVGKPGEKGDPGEDGGWYTPAVTQPDKNTLQFEFTPSNDGMPAVEPVSVKLPEGSTTSVQTDWNQTDETAPDFLKNKPFGEFGAVLFPEGPAEFINLDDMIGLVVPCEESFISGNILDVTWGEDLYTTEILDFNGMLLFGNAAMVGLEDTGEPFFGMIQPGMVMIADLQATEPVSRNFALASVFSKKIDVKYINANAIAYLNEDENGIKRVCKIFNDPSSVYTFGEINTFIVNGIGIITKFTPLEIASCLKITVAPSDKGNYFRFLIASEIGSGNLTIETYYTAEYTG